MLGGGAQFPPPQPQPQRRDPLKVVLAIVIAVSLLALGGIVVVWAFGGNDVEGQYQNEDYQPPEADTNPDSVPIPAESDYETAMKNNPFYDQSIPAPVRCETGEIDPTTASTTEQEEYLNAMTACLMRVWDNTVQEAGFSLPRPTVTVYTDSVTTKCGEAPDQNAFYCLADQQVYFADNVLDSLPSDMRDTSLPLAIILAHEFGHALQGRTAILAAAKLESHDLPAEEAYVYSRRLEAQADCLSGMFVNSVSRSMGYTDGDRSEVGEVFYQFGDDVLTGDPDVWGNHGLGATRRAWSGKGLATTVVGTCNSFRAPESEVR